MKKGRRKREPQKQIMEQYHGSNNWAQYEQQNWQNIWGRRVQQMIDQNRAEIQEFKDQEQNSSQKFSQMNQSHLNVTQTRKNQRQKNRQNKIVDLPRKRRMKKTFINFSSRKMIPNRLNKKKHHMKLKNQDQFRIPPENQVRQVFKKKHLHPKKIVYKLGSVERWSDAIYQYYERQTKLLKQKLDRIQGNLPYYLLKEPRQKQKKIKKRRKNYELEKKFQCMQKNCSRVYADKKSRKNHMLNVHGIHKRCLIYKQIHQIYKYGMQYIYNQQHPISNSKNDIQKYNECQCRQISLKQKLLEIISEN